MVLDIITCIGILAAVIEVGFIIYKNYNDNHARQRRATIDFYNQVFFTFQQYDIHGIHLFSK